MKLQLSNSVKVITISPEDVDLASYVWNMGTHGYPQAWITELKKQLPLHQVIMAERFSKERETASRTISQAGLYASPKNDNNEIDRIAKQRIKLMAAKYASDAASAEILARLEMLNRRLLERSPRVLPGQVEALESANDKLNRIRAARVERAKRLGITA